MNNIEKELKTWFSLILEKYTWLRIKFEYSDKYGVHLVSFAPADLINTNDEFCIDCMSFEDNLNIKYNDNAPLFCNEEELFKLSPYAETIEKHQTFNTVNPEKTFNLFCDFTDYVIPFNDNYSLAA